MTEDEDEDEDEDESSESSESEVEKSRQPPEEESVDPRSIRHLDMVEQQKKLKASQVARRSIQGSRRVDLDQEVSDSSDGLPARDFRIAGRTSG